MCRRDHGLSWHEFQDLTLAQLEALEERRAVAIRHERFNAALVASAIINGRGASDDPVSPFDFLAGFERDPEAEEREKVRRSVKSGIAAAFSRMEGYNAEQIAAARADMVRSMEANGVEDPDGLIREVFPDL